MGTLDTLIKKIENAKNLDFGTILSASIELFKKVWVQGLVMLLLNILMMLPFYILMYLPLLGMGLYDPESFSQGGDFNMALLIPFYTMVLVFSFFAMVINFGLKSAFFRICKAKDFNEATRDDYFYFFKKPYLMQTIKLSVISFGIAVLATLLCFLPIIYAIVPLSLINVIFAFNPEMAVSDVVKLSFKLGNKKWLITFGLIFVAGFLAQIVGMLLCFVGVVVTTSFAYIPLYFIYKDVIGFDDVDVIDEIGTVVE
ncbi:hypothetical protein KO566_04120 [Flavobacteriaceae bacterium XHP0103]|uniref:hypothetical protein n=1 Tax=Marixanthotalea marina TaxID=2844359 RepID=UPI002989B2CA|nr:hypothetical protein [Marixanthotalea marina]MBU3821237.1 hypothetical protein [Marixanthotalea marina]